jgi:apolipoprotein N-acyltransferase
MWLYAILTIGESYQPAAHFSLAMVGYTAADAPGALLLAPIGGVYALSFFIVFIASLMASAHSRKLLIFIALATYVLIGVWITSIGEDIKATEPAISVALVTTDFDPQIHTSEREQEEVRKRVAALVAESGDTDIVVLPEGLRFLQFGRRGGDNLITATATPKLLIDSSSDIEGVRRLELRLQNEDGSIERGPRKQFLLPYGEYLPVVFRALGLLVVGNDGVTAIEQNRTLMPGRFDVFGPLSPYSLGVRFCSESMSPELFRKETRAGAQILVNTANSSWFHHSATLERKMISIARVRAAESARYLAVANNQGPSLAINPLGRVIARSHSPEEVVQVRVATLTGMTPYVQFGSWILLLPLALVILSAVKISLARRKSDL